MSPEVFTLIDLPSGKKAILYDWMAVRRRNLSIIFASGEKLLPDPPIEGSDSFGGIKWDGEKLIAQSWSGFTTSVDIDTGEVTVLEFTK